MKVAIMQPYLFPYIGYFQLIRSVDKFVIYDNIEYTKKGWINRNRILLNGADFLFSVPLKKDSDYLNVNERYLADNWVDHKKKLKGQIVSAYFKAPEFEKAFPVVDNCLNYAGTNLFDFILYSVQQLCAFLDIRTELIVSSTLDIDFSLKGEEKVIAIAKKTGAEVYINAIGGQSLYSKENFLKENLELKFIKSEDITYRQLGNSFTPHLSIIDVVMFNSPATIREFLNAYTLV
jgi:hypothetical protein